MTKKLFLLIAIGLGLTGCKYHFDQQIDCPSFSATNVAVYKYDADTWLVFFPPDDPRSHVLINDAGCKVSPIQ